MSNDKDWVCTVAGCTREDRYCMRLAGEPTDPTVEPQFVKAPGQVFCRDVIDWIYDARSGLVQATGSTDEDDISADDGTALTPSRIYEQLLLRVRGQDSACRVIASALYKHRKNRELRLEHPDVLAKFGLKPSDIKKSNVLMPGPSGCGKTYIVETVASIVDEPFYVERGTTGITSAGYVGDNVEDIGKGFFFKVQEWMKERGMSGHDKHQTVADYINQNGGIIAIDEVDKLAASKGTGKDVNGQGVQDRLLTFMEGEEVTIEVERGVSVVIDTTHIQFILMGAFSPAGDENDQMAQKTLKQIIKERRSGGSSGGMDQRSSGNSGIKDTDLYLMAIPEDFVKFGFKPEFVGRVSGHFAPLRDLVKDDFVYILTQVKGNPVAKAKALFSTVGNSHGGQGYNVIFSEDAIDALAVQAEKAKTGARGLEQAVNAVLSKALEIAPDIADEYNEIYISATMVNGEGVVIEEGEEKTFRKSTQPRLEPLN